MFRETWGQKALYVLAMVCFVVAALEVFSLMNLGMQLWFVEGLPREVDGHQLAAALNHMVLTTAGAFAAGILLLIVRWRLGVRAKG